MQTTAVLSVGRSPAAFLARYPSLSRQLAGRGRVFDANAGGNHDEWLETELMALYRDTGRRDVFEALYSFSRGRLLGWLTSFVRSRLPECDPLDVLQDAYVNIYRYAKSFRDERPGSFRVWSRTVAGNLVRRVGRDRGRLRLLDSDLDLIEPVCPCSGPQEVLTDREQAQELARAWMLYLMRYAAAFEDLAPRDRRALELIEGDGLTYAEAADELGVRLSNMKMIVFRARRRLRRALDEGDCTPAREPVAVA